MIGRKYSTTEKRIWEKAWFSVMLLGVGGLLTVFGNLMDTYVNRLDSQIRPSDFPDLSHEVVETKQEAILKETYHVLATCYTASADETDDTPFITADGTDLRKARYGVIAANWLPFGTIVEIDGKGYVVADRMNERYGKYRVDILVKTKEEAFKCSRYKTLTVLK